MLAFKFLTFAAVALCVSEAKTTPVNNLTVTTRACQGAYLSLPYCNTALPIADRVEDFIARLWQNTSWIAPQLTARHGGGGNPGPTSSVPALGLPDYDWGLNCIHGVQSGCVSEGDKVFCPTSFSNPVNFGATFNDSHVLAMGAVIAEETRALWLAGAGEESSWSGRPHIGLDLWSPNINIARDPRWGRNVEVASEDPLINGRYGVGYTRGVQVGQDPRLLKTVVTLKHWDAYSLENSDGFTRNNFNAIVSNYALATTYLPAFRTSIVDAGAAGVMCSYNSVNSEPTCASEFLTDILRGQWNFTGYITSDTGALEDVYREHKYVATEAEAACVSLINGTTDVCSGAVYHDALLTCPQEAINAALRRTFTLRFALGLFDPVESTPYWSTPLSSIGTPAARALNLLATRESMVLLKHSRGARGALPWAPGMKIAVLGPHANATTALVGNYLGQLCPDDGFDCLASPFTAIRALNHGGTTTLGQGPDLTKNNSASWAAALALGRAADAIVLVLGIDGTIEGESNDRTDIDLPAVQHAFAAAVAALGKPCVLFLVHGGSLDTSQELALPAITGIVDAFYPGFDGADAMAQTLFGLNDNLGGKMAFTTYPASYVDTIKMSDMELDGPVGRSYRYYTGETVYPFGYGLTLTTFALAPSSAWPTNATSFPTNSASAALTYTLTVTNTGATTGDEVIQAYFLPTATPAQPASRLNKQLFDYTRVHLGGGGSAQVSFEVSSATLRMSDRATGNLVSTPGTFDLLFTNGVDLEVGARVTVTGEEVTIKTFPY